MKTLYLLRHAKSSWDNPDLEDFDRPLNARGEKDAPRMGKRLRKGDLKPELICSSPAVRAITTARLVAEEMEYPVNTILRVEKLYHAGSETILGVLRGIDDRHGSVMLVGHNPGFTDFANDLLDEEFGNIPTAGVVIARLNIKSWKEARWGCGELLRYDYPKKEK